MQILKIPLAEKSDLRVLFIAKHALSDGRHDIEDGNHAVYHHEVRTTLEEIGLNITLANDPAIFFSDEQFDFVFSLLNRAGYFNSEMLIPLLCRKIDIPCLGASPIIRGLGDDKHLMKRAAKDSGVPISPSVVIRQGQNSTLKIDFDWDRLIVKPNASSASWGIMACDTLEEAQAQVDFLLGEGWDVIVEEFFGDYDVVVPVIGGREPIILPTCRFIMPDSEDQFRSYEEKRGLAGGSKEILTKIDDSSIISKTRDLVEQMLPEVYPFDYCRFEFRYDKSTGEFRFMEVNLSCNLWSKKTVSGAARLVGISHVQLIEHLVAHSMERQGLITAEVREPNN